MATKPTRQPATTPPPESDPFSFGSEPAPTPVPSIIPEPFVPASKIAEDAKIAQVLGPTEQPMAETFVKELRLEDLSFEQQKELAIAAYETLGKAAGYLPDYNNITENMKAAHMKVVRDIWMAAQRKARTYNE